MFAPAPITGANGLNPYTGLSKNKFVESKPTNQPSPTLTAMIDDRGGELIQQKDRVFAVPASK